MRTIPVDTSSLVTLCATPPVPRVRDTGELRTDKASGQTLYEVGMLVVHNSSADVVKVSVPGEPKGLATGQPVRVTGLVALPWEQNGRHGIAFQATKIEPASTVKPV